MKNILTGFGFGKRGARPKILITAGMDGDEYTGILAAYDLVKHLGSVEVRGEVNIVPVVNWRGFQAGTSENPADGKNPKRIYPGRANGSPSETLIDSLRKQYIAGSDLWLDLHAGSLTEELVPCVLSYETGSPRVDSLTARILRSLSAERIVYEKKGVWKKVTALARDGISYLMFESGWGGSTKPSDCRRHIRWVHEALSATGIVTGRRVTKATVSVYRAIREEVARTDAIWFPAVHAGDTVEKGTVIGTLRKPDFVRPVAVSAGTRGTVIWLHRTPNAQPGTSLFAVAGDRVDFTF